MALDKTLERLLLLTEGCREDMHEPDEQGLAIFVEGDHLDNAMGDIHPPDNCGEIVIGFTRDNENIAWLSLANIIALARKAELKP